MPLITKTCSCGKSFITTKPWGNYCSLSCRGKAARLRERERDKGVQVANKHPIFRDPTIAQLTAAASGLQSGLLLGQQQFAGEIPQWSPPWGIAWRWEPAPPPGMWIMEVATEIDDPIAAFLRGDAKIVE